ncbi:C40 family peptidase [Rhabdobacter roseus]|uniref:Cell wall-associated NlpC family hydrolase n=1 Tax=Rhabdobacter roseus TaxID=1655419 RepID=A0A840TE78_9BACT|nr:C40 family peptidase [Rhabdobacter roseus]MBB5282436.1 cell wall-associated NlpC family hydrolase [Rhabdobacter roseus]
MQKIIEEVRTQYAPDRRVAIFEITADEQGTLSGKTNLPEARQSLIRRLQEEKLTFNDQIQVLPAEVLGAETYGVVRVSVANIRSQPRDAAELATQALLGMPLKVLDKDRGWYLVQTPDQYIAWIDWGGMQRMDQAHFEAWQSTPKLIYLRPYGFSYEKEDAQGQTVSDLVAGDVLQLLATKKDFYHVKYPDGREAHVAQAEARPYHEWVGTLQLTEESLVQTARRMMGIPYLWGGTSYKGMDCSGFTKTIYYLNGWVLPRDASQQVHTGELVDTSAGFEQLRPGDLLFFGTKATETTPEKVTHVGMWIGNQEFIHASGQIRTSSLDPAAPNYDAFERNRFLRAKRLLGNAQGVSELK